MRLCRSFRRACVRAADSGVAGVAALIALFCRGSPGGLAAQVAGCVPARGLGCNGRFYELSGIIAYHVHDNEDRRLRSWPVC